MRGVSTEAFVDFIADRVAGASSDALTSAEVLMLDALGVAVAGSATPEGVSIAKVMATTGRLGEIAVPGRGERFDVAAAALISGTNAYSIGLTDTHGLSITHPGPSVVSAALAVGQAVGASGVAVLRAVIAGCEAVVRIGSVVNPSHRQRGFHPTATCNPFGAAVAAGHLLGLNRQQTLWALGLVGSMSGGLYEFRREGAMLMALHGGLPASSGVTAAYLAADGFTGPSTVLEGSEGFFRAFADEVHPQHLMPTGGALAVEELSLRPYCACRYAHAAIDALERLWSERGSRPAPHEIANIVVSTHRVAVDQETDPVTVVGARLSTRFNVALAVVHGPRLTEVTPQDLQDSAILSVAERVVVIEDPVLTAEFPRRWAAQVSVELRDGRTLGNRVDIPKGEPENPMTSAEIDEKFNLLVVPVLGASAAQHLRAGIRSLADLDDLGQVVASMRPGVPPRDDQDKR